ncbi:MAG: protein-disulfide reductase DsbD N-terminal domain-containing protein [Pyrinomonadaceae bacterium]
MFSIRRLQLLLVLLCTIFFCSGAFGQSAADVKVSGDASPDKIKRGGATRGSVVIEIPSGLHIQSSRPLDKFLVATKLELTAPSGVRIGPVSYPRARVVKLKFSKSAVAVYEGRAVLRFRIALTPSFGGGSAEIKGKLRFQACNDEACFPPVTRDVSVWVNLQ